VSVAKQLLAGSDLKVSRNRAGGRLSERQRVRGGHFKMLTGSTLLTYRIRRHASREVTNAETPPFPTARATFQVSTHQRPTSNIRSPPTHNGFSEIADFTYLKNVNSSRRCWGRVRMPPYSERLDVMATATNGYGTLSGYNARTTPAFALALPCPTCDCEEGTTTDRRRILRVAVFAATTRPDGSSRRLHSR